MAAITTDTRVSLNVGVQIAAWVIGLVLFYSAVNARVSVLETKADEFERRMQGIERKLDVLIQQHQSR